MSASTDTLSRTPRRALWVAGCALVLAGGVAAATPPRADAAFRTFETPSGNIACIMDVGVEVRCDIRRRRWRPPPKPKSCPVDWGQGMVVGVRGRGRFVCAGDTALSPPGKRYRRLAYGKRIRIRGLTCVSRRVGLTCTNRAGRGFFLSRQRYRLL